MDDHTSSLGQPDVTLWHVVEFPASWRVCVCMSTTGGQYTYTQPFARHEKKIAFATCAEWNRRLIASRAGVR